MFLALKEMKYSKLRYSLIIGIMLLLSFVVFMLSGLANGLATQFKQVVEDWDATEIVLSEESNKMLSASQLTQKEMDNVVSNDKASINLYSSAITVGKDKINVSMFGTQQDAFFIPDTTEGATFTKKNEAIISQNLADDGVKVGDTLTVGKDDTELSVVGIFPATYYTITPVIYTTLDTVVEVKYGGQPFKSEEDYPINAILTNKKSTDIKSKDLESMTTTDFIEHLPGFSAQNLTLNAMIYFLFFIAAAVIGIFMYVITLQKISIFGVMKVQGIRTSFISTSIIAQSFVVGVIGASLAGALSYAISFVLPKAMPFAIFPQQWLLYGITLIFVSIIGGLFSTITVTKVDPINAIGG